MITRTRWSRATLKRWPAVCRQMTSATLGHPTVTVSPLRGLNDSTGFRTLVRVRDWKGRDQHGAGQHLLMSLERLERCLTRSSTHPRTPPCPRRSSEDSWRRLLGMVRSAQRLVSPPALRSLAAPAAGSVGWLLVPDRLRSRRLVVLPALRATQHQVLKGRERYPQDQRRTTLAADVGVVGLIADKEHRIRCPGQHCEYRPRFRVGRWKYPKWDASLDGCRCRSDAPRHMALGVCLAGTAGARLVRPNLAHASGLSVNCQGKVGVDVLAQVWRTKSELLQHHE